MSKIFVFGSNLAGRHGAGSAKAAHDNWGAEYGVGVGRTGMAYAIPTKDHALRTMPLHVIKRYVDDFLTYAWMNSHLQFHVVAIGTGLAGYHHDQIAPLFNTAPDNCILPKEWGPILRRHRGDPL